MLLSRTGPQTERYHGSRRFPAHVAKGENRWAPSGITTDRSQYYQDLSAPFYGANRPGSTVSRGLRDWFWQMCMTVGVGADAHGQQGRDRAHQAARHQWRSGADPLRQPAASSRQQQGHDGDRHQGRARYHQRGTTALAAWAATPSR